MLKSTALTTLSLLQSPAFIRPISWLVTCAPVRVTVPALARYMGSFTRQLYTPFTRLPTGTVKKPLMSVVRLIYSVAGLLPRRRVRVMPNDCRKLGCAGRPCHVTCPTSTGTGVGVLVRVFVGVRV